MSEGSNYARALFEKAVDKYRRDLHTLRNALEKSALVTRLDNAAESFDSKKALINSVLPRDADPEVRNLALLLASQNKIHLLNDVVSDFDRMVAAGIPGNTARVTSAIELTSAERTKLESKLLTQYGADLAFDYRLDPSILGGVIVRIGDIVMDGSVSAKLAAMKQKMETAR